MSDGLITDQTKFLRLVKENKILPAVKTYSDTLLFYYVGNLAIKNTNGNLFEIGVGGSTYPMSELSEQHDRKFIVVDLDSERLNFYADLKFFPKATTEKHHIKSSELPKTDVTNLSYCHIDGHKDYEITLNDLEFCCENLSPNGIICQDDYGNNKWSTVTDAVQNMISRGKLVMLIVGDSSAWLTKPEYYDYWMSLFSSDKEFTLLRPFLNLTDSIQLHKYPNYLFMQSTITSKVAVESTILEFYNNLLKFNHKNYLQMPYKGQSMIGFHYRHRRLKLLTKEWSKLRGPSWPDRAPTNNNEIDSLPDWIKDELKNLHQIVDLYQEVLTIEESCLQEV